MSIRIASIQLNSQTDIEQNLTIIEKAINHAANEGARLVVLPENACLMGRQSELAARFDEVAQRLGKMAKSAKVHLMAGTLPCPTRPDGTPVPNERSRQTSLVFDDTGEQIARYDKIHLFRATVNDSTGNYDESKTFEAGDTLVVAPLHIDGQVVRLGLMICFDVRFATLAQRLRQMGADIISVPAAFTHRTGQAHWQMLLQARALDSQCMVIGSTQGGTHHIGSRTRQTWGHAMIVNATGEIVASTERTECSQMGFEMVMADFDTKAQKQIRENMPIFECFRI
ncbi:carbon-nitrogen hydrolase [Moraxella caviae]|uniref:Carbon-nitrogen hydrolase n=1 Tax=Moraxella caviae TaxID=34060 RepID=A0A1T0AAY7_9GAMM|nr:carbon-nitrogen hydrolase family protein [Moraxella caviae]OOR92799.1 carbon-nitrogen hydrolase [Moraxella caviae]STZ14164.1 N-carbamoyl-D-amino acid hydrolase [Moraxella caviae]VEW12610.1 N-carbamoyl-D-amino acid hydrolase [Moraxella caviae]